MVPKMTARRANAMGMAEAGMSLPTIKNAGAENHCVVLFDQI